MAPEPRKTRWSTRAVALACAGVVLLLDLWLLFTGHMGDADLVTVQESEDLAALKLPGGESAGAVNNHKH